MVRSKFQYKGKEMAAVTMVISKVQTFAALSPGMHNKASAPARGRKIRVLRMGNPISFMINTSIPSLLPVVDQAKTYKTSAMATRDIA